MWSLVAMRVLLNLIRIFVAKIMKHVSKSSLWEAFEDNICGQMCISERGEKHVAIVSLGMYRGLQ